MNRIDICQKDLEELRNKKKKKHDIYLRQTNQKRNLTLLPLV